jgi:hypothetical protein
MRLKKADPLSETVQLLFIFVQVHAGLKARLYDIHF